MAYKFEIFKDKGGEFRVHIRAPNGEIMLSSQGYKEKKSAQHCIDSVKQHAPGAIVQDNT